MFQGMQKLESSRRAGLWAARLGHRVEPFRDPFGPIRIRAGSISTPATKAVFGTWPSYASVVAVLKPAGFRKKDSSIRKREFDPQRFLATIGEGRKVVALPKKQTIFTQGDAAEAVFYIQKGKVRLTVVSKIGKEPSQFP
jgi:hypothetical protein